MLDLFTIFSKGGIVLWCFQGTGQALTSPVNALIKTVILQERGGSSSFTHEALTLKYKLDNEFELVFVVAYQKILQLSYIDKFLTDIQMEFRNKYKDDLNQGNVSRNFDEFHATFQDMLKRAEEEAKNCAKEPRKMRSFEQSIKSQKTVASMIERKEEPKSKKSNKKSGKMSKGVGKKDSSDVSEVPAKSTISAPAVVQNGTEVGEDISDDVIRKNRENFMKKRMGGSKKPKEEKKSPSSEKKPGQKAARVWALGGNSTDSKVLDYSGGEVPPEGAGVNGGLENVNEEEQLLVGQMKGDLQDMETYSSSEEEEEKEEVKPKAGQSKQSSGGFGFLSGLKNLVGSKQLTRDDIQPALDKMKDHLIAKNVAAEIAEKLCESVASKLEGRVLGTFSTVMSTVKQSLQDSCMQLLRPKRRIDILRDAMAAREAKRPYSITFCGVNGVGKSTNLAKICFWLVENGLRVLIAACDTFRAGAVEQLRTHMRKLNALHPKENHGGREMVQLYEKGYGKDAAGIAMEAINLARDKKFDVVLIDTAGRMQDNEPLMRALSKLIAVNQPDLVLFVGEALVGNEAVDQLVKFNQALADHSQMANPRLIDGMILTKFDTIDDKVGAAISMTYTTGQPIVFVGTGQTYTDLKNLNAKAVVHSLLKV